MFCERIRITNYSLRGEWLYSQGRGRHFRVGDQEELSQYLASVCPLTGEQLETEEDRKLRLILSKAQHHQKQLREQLVCKDLTEFWFNDSNIVLIYL